MRKKCVSCGLIGFATEDICRRCGSAKLFKIAAPGDLPQMASSVEGKIPWWSYIVCFAFACVIEFAALLPVLANIGMRHSANAPLTEFERNSQIAAFVLHMPASVILYLLSYVDGGMSFLFAPFIQIIFWTFLVSYLWRKIKNKFL